MSEEGYLPRPDFVQWTAPPTVASGAYEMLARGTNKPKATSVKTTIEENGCKVVVTTYDDGYVQTETYGLVLFPKKKKKK